MTLKACFNCSALTETSGDYCPNCGTRYGATAGPGALPTSANSGSSPVALAFTLPLLIAGALGVLAPYLPYLSFEEIDISGWNSREFTGYYDLYSQGPAVTLFLSLVCLAAGVGLSLPAAGLVAGPSEGLRLTNGIVSIVAAVALMINAAVVFSAIDEAAQLDGVLVEMGFGWALTIISSLVIATMGILILSVGSVFRNKKQGAS